MLGFVDEESEIARIRQCAFKSHALRKRGAEPRPYVLCPVGPLSARILRTLDLCPYSTVKMRITLGSGA